MHVLDTVIIVCCNDDLKPPYEKASLAIGPPVVRAKLTTNDVKPWSPVLPRSACVMTGWAP